MNNTKKAVIEGTKNIMRKEMMTETLTKEMIRDRDGRSGWNAFYKKIFQTSLMLLRELHRMEGALHSIPEDGVTFDMVESESSLLLVFITERANVSFQYKMGDHTDYELVSIKEQVYEDALALF